MQKYLLQNSSNKDKNVKKIFKIFENKHMKTYKTNTRKYKEIPEVKINTKGDKKYEK